MIDPISLIFTIIVIGLIYWAVSFIPLPYPFPSILQGVFILIVVVVILNALGIHVPSHF
jgi:hypothetical protein